VRFLILADAEDALAVRVAAELIRRHSASAVSVVTPEEVVAPRIRCLIPGTSEFTLHNGVVLQEQALGVVFNRLRTAPVPCLLRHRALDNRL
jgi:hypothetical protein